MTTRRRAWTGGEGAGSPTFTAQERHRVVTAMLAYHRGRANRVKLKDLEVSVGLQDRGRTLRAILSATDGVEYILVIPSDGWAYVAEYLDEAARTTRQLRSRARKLTDRADRRDRMVEALPRQQGVLWDDDDIEEEEIDL